MQTESPQETQKIAKQLVKKLKVPQVLALYGELGSGKTTFVQALGEELGIKRRILSPTFVFMRSYPLEKAPYKIFNHVDLYRAGSLEDCLSIGIEEILKQDNSLTAIEWPEKIEKLFPENTLRIKFKRLASDKRGIEIV